MKKFILGLSILFIITITNCNNNLDTGFIKLEYNGESDKPIPTVVFYVLGSFDTTTLKYGNVFQVSKKEFKMLESSIIKDKYVVKLNIEASFYKFSIIKNNQKFVFATTNKNSTQEVFDAIISQFRGDKKNSIQKSLENIIRRI